MRLLSASGLSSVVIGLPVNHGCPPGDFVTTKNAIKNGRHTFRHPRQTDPATDTQAPATCFCFECSETRLQRLDNNTCPRLVDQERRALVVVVIVRNMRTINDKPRHYYAVTVTPYRNMENGQIRKGSRLHKVPGKGPYPGSRDRWDPEEDQEDGAEEDAEEDVEEETEEDTEVDTEGETEEDTEEDAEDGAEEDTEEDAEEDTEEDAEEEST
ncbi:hypothetical protein LSAT2_005379 [Lamellibrachia satsuma]|nr:hypothetical protein LSAT2_005379 [Lamellibrachia satsuma]